MTTFTLAGVGTAGFKPHATRSASAAHHKQQLLLSVKEICARTNRIETPGINKLFYERYVA